MLFTKSNINSLFEYIKTTENPSGTILIDKEKNWTSFDIIAKLRQILKIKKIGHAGTLDPLATGLLIICFGKETKNINTFQNLSKQYDAVIKLGATTKSGDAEFEEENLQDISNIATAQIHNSIAEFVGSIKQIPPAFSAKKIKGKALYKYARKGIEINPEPIEVTIHSIQITNIALPYVSFTVRCSKGTYIRTLATDIGSKLTCGAYLYELRRTRIGNFAVEDAIKITELTQLQKQQHQN